MRISKAFICVCSTVLIATLFANSMALAVTTNDVRQKIEQARKQKEAAQKKVNKIAGQQKEATQEMKEISGDLTEINKNIDLLDNNIYNRIITIKNNNAEIDKQNKTLEELNVQFRKRVVSMNEQGSIAYLEVLLGASSFTDFLSRLTLINYILQHDKQLMKSISDAKAEIVSKNNQNQKEKADLEDSKSLKLEQQGDGQSKLTRQKQLYSQLQKDKDANNKIIEAAEKEEERQNQILRELTAREQSKSNRTFAGGKFAWPLSSGGRITSNYGYRSDPKPGFHKGVDISDGKIGTPVVAANDGVVITAGYNNGGYGNYVIVDHGSGIATLYAHFSSISVKTGQEVKRGDKLGAEGSTGYSTGAHLHFEVIINGQNVNPLGYIQ